MLEVMCLLHNFVAAAKSLVDHTRVAYRDLYAASGAIPQYQTEVDRRFVNDPLSKFIAGLREMAQHVRLPMVSVQFHLENHAPRGGGVFETQFQLKVADLRRFSGGARPPASTWTVQARRSTSPP
jgi:hypothetical protein